MIISFKKPSEVVGIHIAKYQALRLAKTLTAYDIQRKQNPVAEMGWLIFTFMGDDMPGTGNATLIQVIAGLIDGYCRVADYPFGCQNFSIDLIDSTSANRGRLPRRLSPR